MTDGAGRTCFICAPLGACMTPDECFRHSPIEPINGRCGDASRVYDSRTPTAPDPPT